MKSILFPSLVLLSLFIQAQTPKNAPILPEPELLLPKDTPCPIPGKFVDIGSRPLLLIALDGIFYDKETSQFLIENGKIVSVGPQKCLDFSFNPSHTPTTNSPIKYQQGTGYIIEYTDGHIAKMITVGYVDNAVRVKYILEK